MIRLYRWLLFLYPADYRAIFAAEMPRFLTRRAPWHGKEESGSARLFACVNSRGWSGQLHTLICEFIADGRTA